MNKTATTGSKPKTIQSISVDTITLVKRLQSVAIGEVVTYDELSTIIGRNVQTEARSNLRSARHQLLRDQQVYFACVLGIGIKRCSDVEKVDGSTSYLNRSRRAASKAIRVASSIDDFSSLTPEKQLQHNLTVSIAGMIRYTTNSNTSKKVEKLIQGGIAPPMVILEAFKES